MLFANRDRNHQTSVYSRQSGHRARVSSDTRYVFSYGDGEVSKTAEALTRLTNSCTKHLAYLALRKLDPIT